MDAVSTTGTMGFFNLAWSDGLRIVDIGELSKQMYCKYCKVLLDLSRTERESRFGLASVFFVVCSGCGFTNEICSGKGKANDEGRPVFEINVKAASSMLCHEAGSKYVVSFLATLNIPLPPPGDSVLPGVQSTQDATSQLLISSHASNGTDGSAFSDVPVFSQGSSVTVSDRFMFTIPDGFKIENESDNGADSFEEVNDSHGSLSQAGAKIDNTLGITLASGKKNVRRKRPRKRAPVKRASTNVSHTGTKTAAGAKRPRKATAPSASSSVTDASISNLSLSKSGISPTQTQSVPESKKRPKVQAAQSESDHNLVQTASGGGAELSDSDPGAVLEEDWGEAEATKPNVSFMCTVCSALLPSVRGLKVHLARKHQVFNELIGKECEVRLDDMGGAAGDRSKKTSGELPVHKPPLVATGLVASNSWTDEPCASSVYAAKSQFDELPTSGDDAVSRNERASFLRMPAAHVSSGFASSSQDVAYVAGNRASCSAQKLFSVSASDPLQQSQAVFPSLYSTRPGWKAGQDNMQAMNLVKLTSTAENVQGMGLQASGVNAQSERTSQKTIASSSEPRQNTEEETAASLDTQNPGLKPGFWVSDEHAEGEKSASQVITDPNIPLEEDEEEMVDSPGITYPGVVHLSRKKNQEVMARPTAWCRSRQLRKSAYPAEQSPVGPSITCSVTACNKTFYTEKKYQQHLQKQHKLVKPLQCLICSKVFLAERFLKGHITSHHSSPESREVECKWCELKLPNARQLKVHIRQQHPKGSKHVFQCKECPANFDQRFKLKTHMREHTGERPYQCYYCELRFRTSSNRLNHVTRMHKQSRFLCDLCGAEFHRPHSLKEHRRVHTGDKPFQCHVCAELFTTKEYLKTHIRTHTGERPYVCPVCSKGFTQRSSLSIHRRKIHGLPKQVRVGSCYKN